MNYFTKPLQQLALFALGSLLSLQVSATTVTWALSNVILDQLIDQSTGNADAITDSTDYLSITGTFSFDADAIATNYESTDPASNANLIFTGFDINVLNSTGTIVYSFNSSLFDAIYSPDPTTNLPAISLTAKDTNNFDMLILEFQNELSTGSVAGLTYALFSSETSAGLVQYVSSATQGEASTVSAVPAPAAVWLFMTGLPLLMVATRRRATV